MEGGFCPCIELPLVLGGDPFSPDVDTGREGKELYKGDGMGEANPKVPDEDMARACP